MAAPKGVDWTKIKDDYITTRLSLADLAGKYDLNKNTIARKCREEGWVKQRDGYAHTVHTMCVQKAADTAVKKFLEYGDVAITMLERAKEIAADEDQFKRHTTTVVPLTAGKDVDIIEKVMKKYDMKAFRDFAASMKDWVAVFRSVYNIPTQAEAEAQRIAAERLELEKKKAEAETQPSDVEYVMRIEGVNTDEYFK